MKLRNSTLYFLKRHLLVHHAGIYTLQYLKTGSIPDDLKDRGFHDSIEISTEECHGMSDFLFEMALKITRVTVDALRKQLESSGIVRSHQLDLAKELLRGLYDDLE